MDMGCFYTLAIVDSAAMNMGMQIFLWDIEFNYFGYILYNSINVAVGSNGNFILFIFAF